MILRMFVVGISVKAADSPRRRRRCEPSVAAAAAAGGATALAEAWVEALAAAGALATVVATGAPPSRKASTSLVAKRAHECVRGAGENWILRCEQNTLGSHATKTTPHVIVRHVREDGAGGGRGKRRGGRLLTP